jgi:hypothetical protein
VSRVNWRYRRGYDTSRLRREIDSLRYRVHQIESGCMFAAVIIIAGINSTGLFADERIRQTFGPNLGRRPVTGKDGHGVAEWEKFLADSAK